MSTPTPIEAFAHTAETTPNKIAFRSNDVTITYAQGLKQIRKFAAYLERRGIKPGDLVLTFLPPRIDWYVILALHSMGVTSCSGHAQIPESIAFDWVITTKMSPNYSSKKQILVESTFLNEVGKSPERDITPNTNPDHLVRLVLTSGTTGGSKTVPFSAQQIADRQIRNQHSYSLGDGLAISLMGIGSVGGGNRIFYAALTGSYFVSTANRGDWKAWVELVQKVRPFQLSGSPVQLESFFAMGRRERMRFDFLGRISSAGTVFPSVLAERISSLTKAPIFSVYGSTEAGLVSQKQVGGGSNPFELGPVLDGVTLEIVNQEGHAVPQGNIGLVRVKTPVAVDGYFNDPEATAKYFRDGWFYPGDEGYISESGRVILAGRSSEFVNAGGVKIDPVAVDQEIGRLAGLADGAAFGVENSSGVVMLALAYVAGDDFNVTQALETLKARLKGKHPTVAFAVPKIPRNEMGKVMRHKLRDAAHGTKPDATIW